MENTDKKPPNGTTLQPQQEQQGFLSVSLNDNVRLDDNSIETLKNLGNVLKRIRARLLSEGYIIEPGRISKNPDIIKSDEKVYGK